MTFETSQPYYLILVLLKNKVIRLSHRNSLFATKVGRVYPSKIPLLLA
jgi:hypothetical protein